MLRIEEKTISDEKIEIHIHGRLEGEYVKILESVCQNHSGNCRKLEIHFDNLRFIDHEGKIYLHTIKQAVCFKALPEFLKIELKDTDYAEQS